MDNPFPHSGPQQAPVPHLHNSGWAQSPGVDILRDPQRFDALKPYVQGIIRRYRNDRRVQVWDLWNEPDNNNGNSYRAWEIADKGPVITPLLKKVFEWAQEVDPSQPLTSGVWINDWSDRTKLRAWEREPPGDGFDPRIFSHRDYAADEILPWDFLDHNLHKRFLWVERDRARVERQTMPCDVTTCRVCGAC